ncbi:plant cysteine oxidase 5-like isoform X2 [Ananas comosus]|uniref:cysteine dioxygenase n=1 Tax=Ananas comosus TaxID=4615 RepID=A0A6P5FZG0_ANACO|nr:plant cysteine oxidase 5-like isoform X2 [Ananas comosus]
MTAIQTLYDACKVSFSPNGPVSSEVLEHVRNILDEIRASDVGLEQEAQLVKGWKPSKSGPNGKKGRNGSKQYLPPIKYLHIHECRSFSIGILCVPPHAVVPLHNHPRMTVLSKLLYGSLLVKSYDWIDVAGHIEAPKARPAKLVIDGEMFAPCRTTILHPTSGGNIRSFKAIMPCALLDILSPPYSSEDGRHCSYFRKSSRKDTFEGIKSSHVAWLEEYQPPESFIIKRGLYKGQRIST